MKKSRKKPTGHAELPSGPSDRRRLGDADGWGVDEPGRKKRDSIPIKITSWLMYIEDILCALLVTYASQYLTQFQTIQQ